MTIAHEAQPATTTLQRRVSFLFVLLRPSARREESAVCAAYLYFGCGLPSWHEMKPNYAATPLFVVMALAFSFDELKTHVARVQ
jgi:hypothetical protein